MLGLFILNFALFLCIVSLVSALNIYLLLRAGNWNWWWQAFFNGWFTAPFMFSYFVYSMLYVYHMDVFWSDVLFLLYAFYFSNLFGFLCGSVSLLSSLAFIHLIYNYTDWKIIKTITRVMINWNFCCVHFGNKIKRKRVIILF